MSQAAMPSSDNSGDAMPSTPRRIIGYYAGWTAKTKNFTPADIPADKLTHINYAFGLIDKHGRAMLQDAEADIGHADVAASPDLGNLGGNFHQLRLLKERHPHLKLMISMGGWTGSGRFSDAVVTEEKRRAFVASCIELFLIRWPGVFDGIDIDWEYPVCCGLPENFYRAEDRRNCTLLFEELRRQLDALGAATGQRYLLTAAIPAGREIPVTSFELREAGQILDWINVMTYDMTGSQRSGVTNFNAPFAESSGDPSDLDWKRFSSVVGTIGSFLDEGVPRDKLVVGVPFYGRGFTGVPADNNGLYQPFTDTISADYHTVKADYLPAYQRFRHPEAEVPWLYDPTRGTMLTYDDPESIGRKTEYVLAEDLGGVMFWELSGDDKESSLLTAISSRLKG
jgi:chitinase